MTDKNNHSAKEKPWTIHSWEDLRRELSSMSPRSKLFKIVQSELVKRGHWKKAPYGSRSRKLQ